MADSLGLLSINGKTLAVSRISHMLSNQFYMGLFRYKGQLYEGSHERFLSRELFDQVQTILRKRNVPKRRHSEPFHFMGEIRCGDCGCSITAERQKTYTYYRCTRKKGACSTGYAREEVIENQLRQCTELVSLPDGWSKELLSQIRQWRADAESSSSSAVADVTARLSEVEGKLSRLTDLVTDGVISAAEYTPRKETLVLNKSKLSDRLASLQQKASPSLDRLELFVRDAQHARDVAVTEEAEDVTAFHRKIGSNFLLFDPERISRGVIGPRQRSQGDGRSDRADGLFPAGKREESVHFSGGDAAVPRAIQIAESPGNASFPAQTVTGDESVAGFIPVPFDPNRNPPNTFAKSGKPLRKIRQKGLPVLGVRFSGPWRLLASRPENEKWWRRGESNPRPKQSHYSFYACISPLILVRMTAGKQGHHANQRSVSSRPSPRAHGLRTSLLSSPRPT